MRNYIMLWYSWTENFEKKKGKKRMKVSKEEKGLE